MLLKSPWIPTVASYVGDYMFVQTSERWQMKYVFRFCPLCFCSVSFLSRGILSSEFLSSDFLYDVKWVFVQRVFVWSPVSFCTVSSEFLSRGFLSSEFLSTEFLSSEFLCTEVFVHLSREFLSASSELLLRELSLNEFFCPASFVQQVFVQRLFVHCPTSLCPASREFLPSVQWAFVQSFCPVSFCLVSFLSRACIRVCQWLCATVCTVTEHWCPHAEAEEGRKLGFDAQSTVMIISGWILRLEGSTVKQRWGKNKNRNRQMYWLVGWLAQKWRHCSLHCVAVLCGWVQINSIFWRHTQRHLHSRSASGVLCNWAHLNSILWWHTQLYLYNISQNLVYCETKYISVPSSDGTHIYTCTT